MCQKLPNRHSIMLRPLRRGLTQKNNKKTTKKQQKNNKKTTKKQQKNNRKTTTGKITGF